VTKRRLPVPNFFHNALFRFSPLARKVLPKSVLRFLLLHVLQTNRPYARMYYAASRLCLEKELLPWLAKRYRKILFVGTASYTFHYERQFRRDQYTTIDRQARNAVWGARDHIIAPIEDIARARPKGFFDCIILNGVFGFGVDEVEHMRVVIKALHEALCPGGVLIVGWNTDRHADPEALGLFEPYFGPNTEQPWLERRRFPQETHLYDFYVRRDDP
jgi:hypothetical protein